MRCWSGGWCGLTTMGRWGRWAGARSSRYSCSSKSTHGISGRSAGSGTRGGSSSYSAWRGLRYWARCLCRGTDLTGRQEPAQRIRRSRLSLLQWSTFGSTGRKLTGSTTGSGRKRSKRCRRETFWCTCMRTWTTGCTALYWVSGPPRRCLRRRRSGRRSDSAFWIWQSGMREPV